MMPRIAVTALDSDIKEVINKTEEIAKEVFGKDGILPMPTGAVEIIPKPVSAVSLREQVIIDILLHQKEDRTLWKLKQVAIAFKGIEGIRAPTHTISVEIIPSPEELWRTI